MSAERIALLALLVAALSLLANGVYTAVTWGMFAETRRMRQAQTEPEVIVYLEQSDRAFNHMNLVVRNIGAGSAFGVRLHVVEDWEVVAGKHVSELGLVRRGLDVLAAGDAIRSLDARGSRARGASRCGYGFRPGSRKCVAARSASR